MTGRIGIFLALAILVLGQAAAQEEGFLVRDMRIDGNQRITDGTIFNYLPVKIGDVIDRQRVQEAIRALYETKFFDDVELRTVDGMLLIVVVERPSIESFTISGNKSIKTEDMEAELSRIGLAEGKTFDRRRDQCDYRAVFQTGQIQRDGDHNGRHCRQEPGANRYRRRRGRTGDDSPDQYRRQPYIFR